MHLAIFDCDGVLVDSEVIYIDCEMAFLGEHGLSPRRDTYIRAFSGQPIDAWERQIGDYIETHTSVRPARDSFERLYEKATQWIARELQAVTGAEEAIGDIDLHKCVASSSKATALRQKLTQTGLLHHFGDNLFSTQMVTNGKPAPDLFLLAAARMGAAAEACVVIEDSSAGVIAAKRAGMTVIGFTAGGHCPAGHGEALKSDGADIVVDAFAALPAAIESLSGSR